ncbi:hypothetical protein ACFZAM_31700 [Streptomyces sp. NPDC008079]|uniref:hypothetical protein n=1 Tax=Streptomyces sp. NPDC008079 TaxID=3364806 RepID=UPI0036E378F3
MIFDFGEKVAIEPEYVLALCQTLTDTQAAGLCQPEALAAGSRVLAAATAQPMDEGVWWLPAEPLATLASLMYAAGVYNLDEEEIETYSHPGVWAERWVSHQVHLQAPRTSAALDALDAAETILMLAKP